VQGIMAFRRNLISSALTAHHPCTAPTTTRVAVGTLSQVPWGVDSRLALVANTDEMRRAAKTLARSHTSFRMLLARCWLNNSAWSQHHHMALNF